MARGLVYLAVVLESFSRWVLSWRVSIRMEVAFCVEKLEDALARHGRPDIFITASARSSRAPRSPVCSPVITSPSAWTAGEPGATTCRRALWRSVKHEEFYLRAYDTVSDAPAAIGRYLDFQDALEP